MDASPEGGSAATQSAHSPDSDEPPGSQGLLGRFAALFSGSASEPSGDSSAYRRGMMHDDGTRLPGLGNLRRMRVEDVAIPRVEITAVPVDIDREALV